MSQYIDSLLDKGLTLETLYQLGVIDQVAGAAAPETDPDQMSIDPAQPAEPEQQEPEPAGPTPEDPEPVDPKTVQDFVTVEQLDAAIAELKKAMHIINLQKQTVDQLAEKTMSIDDAITGLYYGNK